MASLAHAALPSSDEEDDDYDPSADPTGEKEDRPGAAGKKAGGKRRRGADGEAAAAADGAVEDERAKQRAAAALLADDEAGLTPAQVAKKARVSAMFDQLHQSSTGSVNKLSKANISLASLCSNTDPKKKRNTDVLWMRMVGLTPGSAAKRTSAVALASSSTPAAAAPTDGDAGPSSSNGEAAAAAGSGGAAAVRAAAAAALAAAKEAATGGVGRSYNKVTITETRRFAGKDLQVQVQVDKDSKEAKRAAQKSAAASTGLDAFLSQIEQKKKVSVLDKSKMDWQDFKKTDKEVQEELEAHARSDKQYLDKQEFLKRAELREYELERDKRLASDVRLRGRL